MKTATGAILILAILLSTLICQAEDNRDQDWAEDNPERICDDLPQVDIGKGQLPLLEGKMMKRVVEAKKSEFLFHLNRFSKYWKYSRNEDIARNDFNNVMNEPKGQHDGFPTNAQTDAFYLILVSVLGFALIAIIISFCIKIFSGNDVIEDDEEAAIESNLESKERDDALSISNMETMVI